MGKRAYFRAVCAATLLACLSALLSQAEGVRARTLQFAMTDSACPDGSKPVNCFADPCTTQCKCGADQKCLADYCGQCSCKCVEASELECKPEKAVCSVSQAGECCGGLVCSPAPDCQPSETARCATVCQAGTTQAEEPPSFDTRCPEGAGKYQCFVAPCDGGDKCKKEYKCVENYCEGCNFDCVPVDDVSYPTDPDTTKALCPDGSQPVQCFADPCGTGQCECSEEQTCVSDYCGGCNCKCMDNPKPMPMQTPFSPKCLEGADKYQCLVSPCGGEHKCKEGYVCVENYCEGCNFDCVPVDDVSYPTDPDTKALCPDGSQPVQCFADPCSTGQCECGEEQTCESNYCGGCNCKCVDKPRAEDPPLAPKCPYSASVYNCLVSPCEGGDKCKPGYTCVENYCDGCNFDCVEVIKMPSDDQQHEGETDSTNNPGSGPGSGSETCKPIGASCSFAAAEDECCGDSQCRVDLACKGVNCAATCTRPLPPILQPKCPDGAVTYNCFASPCDVNKCDEGYTCVENYCGGCNFTCVVTPSPLVKPTSKCPEGADTYACLISPCDVNKCDEGLTCVENYCEGCNFDCISKKNDNKPGKGGNDSAGGGGGRCAKPGKSCSSLNSNRWCCNPSKYKCSAGRCKPCAKEGEKCSLRDRNCCAGLKCKKPCARGEVCDAVCSSD